MRFITTYLVLFVVWILLAGVQLQEIILGAGTVFIITFAIYKYTDYKLDIYFPVKLLRFILIYIPVFLRELIIANFDVAKRVLSFKIPLNPGFVKVKTGLKGDFGKLTLANSITLTPGTLTIDVDGEDLYIHCVDVKGSNTEEHTKNICGPFDKVLGGIF